MCVNCLSGVDHGTSDQGALLLTSNRLSSTIEVQKDRDNTDNNNSLCVILFPGLDRSDTLPYVEFSLLNFFNSENHGKRPLHPLETATPKRQRQNTDFTESKASFLVYEMKKRLRGNVVQRRCSLHN